MDVLSIIGLREALVRELACAPNILDLNACLAHTQPRLNDSPTTELRSQTVLDPAGFGGILVDTSVKITQSG